MRLNRFDEAGWRAIARSCGVSDDVAFELWQRAQAEAGPDFSKAEALFRRMVEETATLDAIADQLDGANDPGEPGKSTRVIDEDLGPSTIASTIQSTVASEPSVDETQSPTTRLLKKALLDAVDDVQKAARSMGKADARIVDEAIRGFMRRQGKPLISVDDSAIGQVMRLADALVTLVEQGRAEAAAGKPLPEGLKSELETKLGVDLGELRVHDDAQAAEQARTHDALAFAQGKNVYFAEGKYDPSSSEGRELIAHEATHVAQQRGGGSGSGVSAPGSAVEREADRVAGAFAAGMAPGAREYAITERAGAGTISRKDPAGAAPAKAITLKSTTTAKASGGTDRSTVGVGEEVKFEAEGGETGDWTASGGTPATGSGPSLLWSAPGKPGQFTIKLKTKDGEGRKDVSVIAPSGVKFTHAGAIEPQSTRHIGAGMWLAMQLDPLNVSFTKATIKEKPGPAHGVSGYFARAGKDLKHEPATEGNAVLDENKLKLKDQAFLKDDPGDLWPRPVGVGSFSWDIPYLYSAGDATDVPFAIVRQTMGIVDSQGTVTVTKGTASASRTPEAAIDNTPPKKEPAAKGSHGGSHGDTLSGRMGATLAGDQGGAAGAAKDAIKNWGINLAGMALDLTDRLGAAVDNNDGTRTITIDKTLGPVKIVSAKFKPNAAGDKVESATLTASLESGTLKGATAQLKVDSAGKVSGKLEVPIEKAKFLKKKVSVEIGDGKITGKATIQPNDLTPPDFPIKTSAFELEVSYTQGAGIEVKLSGSASVTVENGFASGAATMEVLEFKYSSSGGISYKVKVTGKIDIHGLADATAAMTYDGEKLEFLGGSSNVKVALPGIEGTVLIEFGQGKLSLDSKDLHFTLPKLDKIKFESVHLEKKNLAAKLSLNETVSFALPGGMSIELSDGAMSIDGKKVSGKLTGAFKMPGADGFGATASVNREEDGSWGGSIKIDGGADLKFGGVEVGIKAGSKLSVKKDATGLAVEGDITGKVKIEALKGANIEAHVIYKTGEPVDFSVDANVKLSLLYSKLGGDLNVKYKKGGPFEFKATSISYAEKPINGQVLFSEFAGKVQGKEITGWLTAAQGTKIKAGSATVTINSGEIQLLPGKKLQGNLDASAEAGGAKVDAKVGWENGKFTWSAEAVLDLGPLTNEWLSGKVRAAAGSDGSGKFNSEGPINFGAKAPEALQGVVIESISGDKDKREFDVVVSAEAAANKLLAKVPSVGVNLKGAKAKIHYGDGKLSMAAKVSGSAWYPKEGEKKLAGNFEFSFDEGGFSGKLSEIQLKAGDYFKSEGGTADLNSGKVELGQPTTFKVPGFAEGTVNKANINVKDKTFEVNADVNLTGTLKGIKLNVALNNTELTATLQEGSPPLKVGFATLKVGAGTNVSIKGKEITAHFAGTVDAEGMGNGEFSFDYEKGKGIEGNAKIHVKPFAMFDAVDIDMKINRQKKLSTNAPIVVQLAPAYQQYFNANATIEVQDSKLDVKGKVTELKGLGKVTEAFKKGGGASITWNQASKQVTMDANFELGGVIPELNTGSTLTFKYDGKVVSVDGTLKPKSLGPVKFDESSAIKAHWDSASKKFTVNGKATATIAELAEAEFEVDANAGGGDPASFYLKGKIEAEKLANKVAKGAVKFSSVAATFGMTIGGAGVNNEFNFGLRAAISAIPAAGITDIQAHLDVQYKSGHGIDGELAVTRAKIGDVEADGKITVVKNKFSMGTLHMKAAFPALTVEGTGTISAGEMGELNTTADLTVTPGGSSVLAQFITQGSIHVELKKWKLTQALGKLHIKTPDMLPIENTVIEVGWTEATGITAKLTTQFNAPMGKGEKGTFEAGYSKAQGLYAEIKMPMYFPGFQRAELVGRLDKSGITAKVDLFPKDAKIIKKASIALGYDFAQGLFAKGSLTLAPTESLEFEVGVKYSQKGGLEVLGIDSKDKDANSDEHEVAKWKKNFPTIPLLTVGVASLGLKFGIQVGAGYRMPKIKFDSPKLEGGLEALDSGGMPAFTFGGSVSMGAYVALSLSVQVVGEIQLLIATCSAGIGAEIMARLNLELGADVKGRFAPGQGATLEIDPFVGASLDLIASLIATLYAEVCWFTIVDKKWTLASATFAHIELGKFRPFKAIGMQFGGPGGTKLTQGLALREDAFDQIIDGVKEGGKNTADEESNRDAREKVTPVLQAFKNAAPQFAELPPGWENGMTVAPVDFNSMFPVGKKEWDYYQDNADTAETVAPAMAMNSPTEKLAKAVGIMARKNPFGAGQLVLAWRRAQIAHMGINPDTGVDVVAEREIVQQEIIEKYNADLQKANEEQKKQDADHAAHVAKQGKDFTKAQADATKEAQQQKVQHEKEVAKTKTEFQKAQDKKSEAAKVAATEGAPVQPAKAEKAPPPPTPQAPPPPKPLAKPAVIPTPPPVPLPPPYEVLAPVVKPAMPSDPGSMPRAAMTIAPQKKQVEPQSPGVKEAPTGGAPDPKPGAAQSQASQAAGAGGGSALPGKGGSSGGPPSGGGASAAANPAPAVKAGVEGITSQQKTLDAKEAQVVGPGKGKGTGGKPAAAPGGKPAAPPAPGAAGAAPGKAPGAPGAAPGAPGAPGAAPGAPGGAKAPAAAELDPTVKAVADAGKADQKAYDQKLDQQSQQYDKTIKQKNEAAKQDTKKLEEEAAAAKKKKEEAAKAGAAPAAPKPTLGAPGQADAPGAKKPVGPIGTKIALDILGKSHELSITDAGVVMAGASPAESKLTEIETAVNAAPASIKEHGAPPAATAKASLTKANADAKKAAGGDEAAKAAAGSEQQKLAEPLKITWKWAEVSKDPAVTGGSIDDPLKHPYYVTFKGRVASLNDKAHITVEVGSFAEQIWTKICKAVKAASPQLNDPGAYSNFAKGWLDMKSTQFQSAIKEFEKIGEELAKAGKSGFATAKNFGFWSKEEGRALAESISDLTLETSVVGGLMDGLPTLDDKKAGWDPEIWGALSQAYANAVVPELLKGKKVNVCVGAGVPAGNIWDAVESAALEKGLKGTKITLDQVTTTFGAAAKATNNRKALDETKNVGGKKGCVFAGDRPGAIAAANAHYSALEAKEKAAGGPAPVPPPPPPPAAAPAPGAPPPAAPGAAPAPAAPAGPAAPVGAPPPAGPAAAPVAPSATPAPPPPAAPPPAAVAPPASAPKPPGAAPTPAAPPTAPAAAPTAPPATAGGAVPTGPAPTPGAAPAAADKPKGPVGTKITMDVLGETHTLYVDDKGVLTVASDPMPAKQMALQLGGEIDAAPADIKDKGGNDAKAATGAIPEADNLAAKAAGGDATANAALPAKQEAVAAPLKRTWQWARVSKDPAVTGGSLEDPLKHPYYKTFKDRVVALSAMGQIKVDALPFADATWKKICAAVKAATPQMNDPKAYSDFAKGWLDMKSAEFQKAIGEFDKIGKELAKAASAQFSKANKFGFWSKDEGRSLSEAMNDLTLETSAVGSLMDGLPTLDGKKAGWDPEIWGALSKCYAEAMVPHLVADAGKKVNVCVGAGVPAGNIWETVESVALGKGLEKAGKTLESVTTYWAAAAKSRGNRKQLDETKNVGFKGSVFTGDRGGALAAADKHFNALPAEQLELPLGKPDPQLNLPGMQPPSAPTSAAPTPGASPTPAVGAPTSAMAAPSPGAQPGAPQPGAKPGAPQPGAPQPGAPQPGAPQPGAPQPGAPQPGAVPAGAQPAAPVQGELNLPDTSMFKPITPEQLATAPWYVKESPGDYWFKSPPGRYVCRDGAAAKESDLDKQIQAYFGMLTTLGIPHTTAPFDKFVDFTKPADERPKAKDSHCRNFRHAIRKYCLDTWGGSRESMDQNVFQKNPFAPPYTGMAGELFTEWASKPGNVGFLKNRVTWVINDAPPGDPIYSDGVIEGTDTFVECKAHVVPTAEQKKDGKQVHVDTEQMAIYDKLLAEIDKKKMDAYKPYVGKKGWYVDSQGKEHHTTFTKVKYVLNNPTVAAAYKKALDASELKGKYILDPAPEEMKQPEPKKIPAEQTQVDPNNLTPEQQKEKNALKNPDKAAGAPAGAQPAAPPSGGAQPAGAQPGNAQPAGAKPAGAQPAGAQPAGAQPAGAQPAGAQPAGAQPAGAQPGGAQPAGAQPAAPPPAGAGAQPAGVQPPAASSTGQPPPAGPQQSGADPASQKPEGPKGPIGPKVPAQVGTEQHTGLLNDSDQPEIHSTPTPITSKLTELQNKLAVLPATDPDKATATAEIGVAQGLESTVRDTAKKVREGDPAAPALLDSQLRALTASVAKIWNIADPGPMSLAKAKGAIDTRATDCKDISEPLAKEWENKERKDLESTFIDTNKMRRAAIEKFLGTAPNASLIKTVATPDPIATQKFTDVDNEAHIDPAHGDLKKAFYDKVHAQIIATPTYTDRSRSYDIQKNAAGRAFNCKGKKIPPDRISPFAARNHSVDKLYDLAKTARKTEIDTQIATEVTAAGGKAGAIATAQADEKVRIKAYRHILAAGGNPLTGIPGTTMITTWPTWYAPGEIRTGGSPPNEEFAKMMTLGALQPEWYPNGTCVLNIDRRISGATRELFKPTAFDGLMSALWTARNMSEDDYGVTGGGLGEFLEANIPFSDVTSAKAIIPSDDFLADIKRVTTEAEKKAPGSTPTEELLRGNDENVKILNTAGKEGSGGAKDMYGQIIDRTKQEQATPSPSPNAPLAAQPTSAAMPTMPATATAGTSMGPDAVTSPTKPTVAPPPAGPAPGKAPPGPSKDPALPATQGGLQQNDNRTDAQTAAGAPAKSGGEFGNNDGKTVKQAAEDKFGPQERDSHFNPVEKVKFEKALAKALLANAALYDTEVNLVSAKIVTYFEDRLKKGMEQGLADARAKYEAELAKLTKDSSPGWWGAVEQEANVTQAQLALQTRESLTNGSLPQKLAVHQNFYGVLKSDFQSHVAQAILGASAQVPWYPRQQTKIKDGKLDQVNGTTVFKDPDGSNAAREKERGRVARPDTAAISPSGPGIEARPESGAAPGSVLPPGADGQMVYRGLDAFTMDESKDFCQRARLVINMPLCAGISGSTAELIGVAMSLGLPMPQLRNYAIAVLAYIGGGGNHSFHEIAIVLKAAGIDIDPDSYNGIEGLIGPELFQQLKNAHPTAFNPPLTPPGAPTVPPAPVT